MRVGPLWHHLKAKACFDLPNTERQSQLSVKQKVLQCKGSDRYGMYAGIWEPLFQWWCSATARQAAESCKPRAGPLSATTTLQHLAMKGCAAVTCGHSIGRARAFISLVASLLICFRAVSRPRPAAFIDTLPMPCPLFTSLHFTWGHGGLPSLSLPSSTRPEERQSPAHACALVALVGVISSSTLCLLACLLACGAFPLSLSLSLSLSTRLGGRGCPPLPPHAYAHLLVEAGFGFSAGLRPR